MGEVARLMQQIEIECEAMKLAMTGFRMAASHDIINRQYEQLGEHYESLGKLIGEKKAIEVVIATLDIALEREDPLNDSARISTVSAEVMERPNFQCSAQKAQSFLGNIMCSDLSRSLLKGP